MTTQQATFDDNGVRVLLGSSWCRMQVNPMTCVLFQP